MQQIFYHYSQWEETKAGLWRRMAGTERQEMIDKCSQFMANTSEFRRFMFRAIAEWPISCEVNLEAAKKVPSWRRVCKSLLRNDYWCKGISFTQHRSEAYEKYLKLMRDKRAKWNLDSAEKAQ